VKALGLNRLNDTRELIRSLAGDHTIILSTHILPEVEQTCEQVLIINKGKLVATDSVPLCEAGRKMGKITVLSVAELLARGIRSIHEETSISELFI